MSLPKADSSPIPVQQAVLLPKSEATKAWAETYGRQLFVVSGTQLGRAPAALPGSHQLATGWQQVSGQHCNFVWDAQKVRGSFSV